MKTRWFEIIWTILFAALVVIGMLQVDGDYYTLDNLARDVIIIGAVWAIGLFLAPVIRPSR